MQFLICRFCHKNTTFHFSIIYQKKYKDVEVFNKLEAREYTDDGDNFGNMNCVVYARNYAPRLAKKLGLKYFL